MYVHFTFRLNDINTLLAKSQTRINNEILNEISYLVIFSVLSSAMYCNSCLVSSFMQSITVLFF